MEPRNSQLAGGSISSGACRKKHDADPHSSGGKLIFSIFGALAEFERNLIREPTQVGLAAARARGRTGGRPLKMTSTKLAQAQRMRENGMHLTDIAEIIGVGRTTLYRHLK
nr:helix-turn-helix domain-containing protein [Rhodococcus sp. 3-2]